MTLSPWCTRERSLTGTISSSSPSTARGAAAERASTHLANWRDAQALTASGTWFFGWFTSPSGVSDQ